MPWWSAYVVGSPGKEHIMIRPWGLELDLTVVGPYLGLVTGYEMPVWLTPTMWAYLGIVIAGLLFSLWAKDKELKLWKVRSTLPSLIIGIVGFSYIVVLVTMFIVATIKTGDVLGLKLIGTTVVSIGGNRGTIVSDLQLGYWLAWSAGTLLIVLALLRNKIIGKSSP
jgi:hypothetical protein